MTFFYLQHNLISGVDLTGSVNSENVDYTR